VKVFYAELLSTQKLASYVQHEVVFFFFVFLTELSDWSGGKKFCIFFEDILAQYKYFLSLLSVEKVQLFTYIFP